jgi:hypothetical protein
MSMSQNATLHYCEDEFYSVDLSSHVAAEQNSVVTVNTIYSTIASSLL